MKKIPNASALDTDSQKIAPPSVSVRRREQERAQLRHRIMEVARKMFVCDGYEAVTLRGIAKAIQYSPAAIYRYFPDKNTLIMEICLEDYGDLTRVISECGIIADPIDRLREMARRYAEWGFAHPNHYQILMAPIPENAPELRELAAGYDFQTDRDARVLLRECIQEAIDTGRIKPHHAQADLILATMWAAIHGVVHLGISLAEETADYLGPAAASHEVRLESMLAVLLEGYCR